MRKNVFFYLFVCVSVFLIGYCKETPTQLDELEETEGYYLEKSVTLMEVDLITENDKKIGTVLVEGRKNLINVTYNIINPVWCLYEANLHIGTELSDVPQNVKGVPIPGLFDYKYKITEDQCIYTYSFKHINKWTCGDDLSLIFAAHASIKNSVTGNEECAWGASNPILRFNNRTPAAYFIFEFECPPPGGRKTQIKM